ncbi:methyl-accepting chemotaxis protein [Labilibacter sediminis]|nr:methyl-accepting chemotaxis protein [Labilibacter sediminis]
MKEFWIFFGIMTCMLPLGYWVLKLIFRRSVILTISLLNLLIIYTTSILYYIVGSFGLQQLLWAVPLALGVAVVVYYYIKKIIQIPLVKAIDQLNNIAEGDLNITNVKDLDADKDELGSLSNSIQKLAFVLKHLMKEISKSSNKLSKSSLKLADNTKLMAQGTGRQAASSQELSSTMEEIASMVGENADNAYHTNKLSNANKGNLKELFDLSEKINNAVKGITDNTKIINDIAEHTNILALNASVEAARAGSAGKGFSVVAKEVRKLAERSQEAADQINTMSAESVRLVEQSTHLFEQMLPQLEKSSDMVSNISAASSDQKSGIEQINRALQDLNNITQHNASTSEDIAFTSEQLKDLSERLKDSLQFFKVTSATSEKAKTKVNRVKKSSVVNNPEPEVAVEF